MIIFFLALFLIYGGVHFYLFVKLKMLFQFGLPAGLILAAFMAIMVVSPILVRVLEQHGLEWWARVFALAGYIWMGFIFVAFSVSLVFDAIRLVLFLIGLTRTGGPEEYAVLPRLLTAAALVIAAISCIIGYQEAKNIRTTNIRVETPRLPSRIGTFRIVQISDVHLGIMVRGERLSLILDEVKAANPDILVSTGDLVDGQMDSMDELCASLREITPPYGKYAVTGNHEFYAGIDQAAAFTEEAGFRLLRGEAVAVTDSISIAGVDDPTGKRFGGDGGVSERELATRSKGFRILLKHQPQVTDTGSEGFDLQLSGHTHKGQIAPFNLITALFYPYLAGRYELTGGRTLYVSSGSGTWGPPIRILAPPEVVIIDLVSSVDEQ